jgi:hypothetical protein
MRTDSRLGIALFALVASIASTASAQGAWPSTPWQTMPRGDASGDRVDLALVALTGDLVGTRRVERIDAPSGYATGTSVTVVLEGTEAEASRSLRAHLPYGAVLDLAASDVVDVSAHSTRLGLGTRQEIEVTRGGELVLLTTSSARAAGIRVARGPASSHDGTRREFGLNVTIAGRALRVTPGTLFHLAERSLLVQGGEVVYEGVRPPDAFDSRIVTIVRIRPRT